MPGVMNSNVKENVYLTRLDVFRRNRICRLHYVEDTDGYLLGKWRMKDASHHSNVIDVQEE